MHSYANAAHERRVAEIVAEEYPGLHAVAVLRRAAGVSRIRARGDDAGRRVRQAAHGTLSAARARRARRRLEDKPFLVMQSSGGVASADQVVRKPITTALSGPAAGALGSAVVAEIAGFPNVVTLDAGGTSTDLCLIEDGQPHVTNGGAVGPFPVRIPMIDIETIGTGGGSIAWITREGHLKVGPTQRGRRARADVLPERRRRADHHRRQSGARAAFRRR